MTTSSIPVRAARDRMINILGIGATYPLRDLELSINDKAVDPPPMIAVDLPATILIEDGQSGVQYRLCDEDGNPLVVGRKSFVGTARQDGRGVDLVTPKITADVTFTILASRADREDREILETYLNQLVSIKVGVDSSLAVAFQPTDDQIADNQVTGDDPPHITIAIDYGGSVEVSIQDSQEGVSYKLVDKRDDVLDNTDDSSLSPVMIGTGKEISLRTPDPIYEDAQLKVRAFRTNKPEIAADLDTQLHVNVRPNPRVGVNVKPSIVDYNDTVEISLKGTQSTATYELYIRPLVPNDYEFVRKLGSPVAIQPSASDALIPKFIKTPDKVTKWDDGVENKIGTAAEFLFNRVGAFTGTGDKRTFKTGGLPITTPAGERPSGEMLSVTGDFLFIVRATKIDNRETLQLEESIAVLVRPDPGVRVDANNGAVMVNGSQSEFVRAQQGVEYKLKPVGLGQQGYYHLDRAVETMRVEVDFVVGEANESDVNKNIELPPGPLMKSTTFNVIATKIHSGLAAQLMTSATIDIPQK